MLSSRNTGRPQPLSATSPPPPGTSQKHAQCRISRERIATSNLDDLRCRQERLAVMRNSAFPCDVLGGGHVAEIVCGRPVFRDDSMCIFWEALPCKYLVKEIVQTSQQPFNNLAQTLCKTEQQHCTRLATPSKILAITLQTPCKLFVKKPASTM